MQDLMPVIASMHSFQGHAMSKPLSTTMAATLLFTVGSLPQASRAEHPHVEVGPNVQVSKSRANVLHLEVVIAADPANAAHLIAGSIIMHGPGVVAYRSLDGGQTWELAFDRSRPAPTGEFGDPGRSASRADPAIAYGSDDTVFYASLYNRSHLRPTQLEVARSLDGGNSWETPAKVSEEWPDRPFLAADCTNGKFRGHIYCNSASAPGIKRRLAIAVSKNATSTFGAPQYLTAENSFEVHPGQSAVLSDGTYIVPYWVRIGSPKEKPGRFEIRLRRSTDGGESFSPEQFLTRAEFRRGPYSIMPMMAAGPGSGRFKDRLYLVWSQKAQPDQRVLLTVSKDKGHTWSRPMVLSEQSAGKNYDAVLPAVAVNHKGFVGVSWYDSRESRKDTPSSNVRFTASLDGADTWLPSVRVTDVPSHIDLSLPVTHINERYSHLGDTAGLAADAAGDFHPAWADKRTGTMQVFTAKVSVR